MSIPDQEPAPISAELAARCATIELLAVDVDGVLTDGCIVVDDHGVESKHFYVRDGLGFALWRRAGKRSAIVSGRSAEVVNRRAAELKIDHVAQGINDKASALRALLVEFGLNASQVCYVGDDLIDLPALGVVGLAACPADAVAEVRRASHLTTRSIGGRGVVREVVEVVMKAQGLWHAACEGYRVPAV
ncbi:KdsC family phosphatase [Paludisphaera borealis]|uniref:3-deoxy-D-manno-octulosonate 8-phosphate phosphatase KdsC n=1 Tax=Paludisphaera borealis TaxID=1387353 RepID=A0A1U7CR75_9BACT|nr:HAD hydrolase family protein [Paludisphaera borealis]APW61445.1 3-deoxy-D-manno-octulosonate 8-phosphate phosphatase KdsC [Paludisphaera borealis]